MLTIVKKIIMPVRFKRLFNEYKDREFCLLDVGCDGSVVKTKQYFKKVKYYGLDYKRNEKEIPLMEGFFQIDLSKGDISTIPDNFFDVIMMSHVIEHIQNGLDILPGFVKKLKIGGVIYLEFPSVRSLALPNQKDTLNFCDDPTHVRVYSIQEIANVLLANRVKIIRAGKRRDAIRVILTPILVIRDFLMKGSFGASLWDLLGFADYVYGVRCS